MKKIFICAALVAFSAGSVVAAENHGHEHAHWSYDGETDAGHWGDMQKDYATCKLGKEQSPIDIREAKKAQLPIIGFEYASTPAEVVNNGHTIQVNLAAGGNVKLAAGSFKLLQFHFHTPSEEKINGKSYPLVAHLVHRNDEGKLAVVAVLFTEGKENLVLAKVFKAMPHEADHKEVLEGGMNAADLLPAKQDYYAFMGSLTTPPCSEGVRWQVLRQTVEISKAQLAAFRKIYPMNARPVQPLNGRTVEEN